MRNRHWHQIDEASLQTDVMRFMAIVAFCLIAILAMVRSVTPELVPEPVRTAKAPEAAPVEPAEAPPPAPDPAPAAPASAPAQKSLSPPAQTQAQASVAQKPIPPQAAVRQQAPTPKPQPQPAERTVATAEVPPAEPGLTLRFSSESDFLRLVARGKVAVYAFNESTFLSLGSNFEFQQIQPPQQVYELEFETIPAHVRGALPGHARDPALKWAVGLPERIERQIKTYLHSAESGELLINRYEEVRHVPLR